MVYLIIIFATCILPVYFYRRNKREALLVASALAGFFILNFDILKGTAGVFHDGTTPEYLFRLVSQFIDSGIALGWNPYMNAGEPFYLNSNNYLAPSYAIFIFINKLIGLDGRMLFSLAFLANYLWFCIGMLLFCLVLFKDFRPAFFCFLSLLYSGMFLAQLGQPAGLYILFYLPFLLFFLLLYLNEKKQSSLVLFFLFLSAAVNLYIPSYLFFVLTVFILAALIFYRGNFWQGKALNNFVLSHKKYILFFLLLMVILAGPALFSIAALGDYVSPQRNVQNLLTQGCIDSGRNPLSCYIVLLKQKIGHLGNIHHAFYFGVVPLFFLPFAVFSYKNKAFKAIIISIAVLVIFSQGSDFRGYNFFINLIPLFRPMRLSFHMANMACFFLICACGFGFREFLDGALIGRKRTVIVYPLLIVSIIMAFRLSLMPQVLIFGIIMLLWFSVVTFTKRNYFYLAFILLLSDLFIFYMPFTVHKIDRYSILQPPFYKKTKDLTQPLYPFSRSLYTEGWALPPDISALISKKAALTAKTQEHVFFRNRKLDEIIKFAASYGKSFEELKLDVNTIYFADKVNILPKASTSQQVLKVVIDDLSSPAAHGRDSVVLIEGDESLVKLKPVLTESKARPASIEFNQSNNPNILTLEVEAPTDGFLVRLENYHKGWQAWVDGKRTKIYPADYAFQAIKINKGRHNIIFKFFSLYHILFLLHIIGFLLLWFFFYVYLYHNQVCE